MTNVAEAAWQGLKGIGLATVGLAFSCTPAEAPVGTGEDADGELFARYVALGNSITAGYQSAGISDSTQLEAYPVLIARQADARFEAPLLSGSGCPPPLADPFSGQRVGASAGGSCAGLRDASGIAPQNLAVPGAVAASLHGAAAANQYTELLLGGRTQIGAMIEARPTFVSVWIGNNDALEATLRGDTTRLTPLEDFEREISRLATAIADSTPAADVVLIGVVNAAEAAPALQPGAFFFAAQALLGKPALPNCAPGTAGGGRLVSILALTDPGVRSIDCSSDARYVLDGRALEAVATRVDAFNEVLRREAADRGWIFVDPATELYAAELEEPDRIRKCQGLPTAASPADVAAAIESTCPSLQPPYFGTLISHDGIHPSGDGHRVIASRLIHRVNEKHGLAIPSLDSVDHNDESPFSERSGASTRPPPARLLHPPNPNHP